MRLASLPCLLVLFACGRIADEPAPAPGGPAAAPDDPEVSRLGSSLALGNQQACARKADGSIWCWGSVQQLLGDGGEVTVRGAHLASLDNVAEIALGPAGNSCLRRLDGSLWCWRSFEKGASVASLGNHVVGIKISYDHACARTSDHVAWCWGRDYAGQLGVGGTGGPDSPTPNGMEPLQVTTLANEVAEVVTGIEHTCARKLDGSLWCWGVFTIDPDDTRIGDGPRAPGTQSSTPVPVVALRNDVVQVVAGKGHTCVLKTDRSVWCFGAGQYGQLGRGSTEPSKEPVEVAALGRTVANLAAGDDDTTCARKSDGSLWCWGANYAGQLGDGSVSEKGGLLPVQVSTLGNRVSEVAVGRGFVCARQADGLVFCWGDNRSGQLGDGTLESRALPREVAGLGR
jgi:Regulator of chromosome condensation (RCC1) repeat